MKEIIRSRKVFDSVKSEPFPAQIVIEDGKIQAVLGYEETFIDAQDVKLTDYGDALIMPSFIDAHTHFFNGAITASDYVCSTLGKCHSKEECAEMIKQFADAHPKQKRIRGTGWFLGVWEEDTLPTKEILDQVIPDRPVYLSNADAHSFWLNSKALEEAGITPKPDMMDGTVVTDENGELTGMLIEPGAYAPAMEKYMDFSEEELLAIYRDFQKVLAENGIAAVSEMFAEDYTEEMYEKYKQLKEMDLSKEMLAHVYIYTKLFGYTDFTPWFAMKEKIDSPHIHINGVKGFIDGVTETYTGLLLEPYTDRPDSCGDKLPLWPEEKMQDEIIAANKAGIQVRLHCIADGSVRMALDMYEQSKKENPDVEIKNTIEHIENIHPDDISRFAEIGVIPSMQPYHVTLSNCDKMDRLGAERCKLEWPIKTIQDAGGEIAIGTDYPVVQIDPFETIYAALTRCDQTGKRMCQNVEQERLSMESILKAYTVGAARAYCVDDQMGTIEAGKSANIIVLSDNLFEIEPEDILKTYVKVNYFEGNVICDATR